MGDIGALKKSRKSLRKVCTNNITYVEGNLSTLNKIELKSQKDVLDSHCEKLNELDSKIESLLLLDESTTEIDLDKFAKDNFDYYLKIKTCQNKITDILENLCQVNSLPNPSLSSNNVQNQNLNLTDYKYKMKLPEMKLPKFYADETKDSMTCTVFFKNFEHLLASYNLPDLEKYNILEGQCFGRAKAMISDLNVINQNYNFAKNLLLKSFAEDKPQKFALIKKLSEIKFVHGKDDPYIFYAEFQKIIENFTEFQVAQNEILLYFIWNSLPTQFQEILVNMLNKSYPDLKELQEKFLEASSRYLIQQKKSVKKNEIKEVTSLATELDTSLIKKKQVKVEEIKNCVLCNKENCSISKCFSFPNPQQKIDRIKELKLCFKCLKAKHFAKNCTFKVSGKCYKCQKFHWAFLCSFEPSKKVKKVEVKNLENSKKVEKLEKKAITKNVELDTISHVVGTEVDLEDSLLLVMTVYPNLKNHKMEEVDTLCDVGSQNSFIEADLANKLKLKVVDENIQLNIKGFNSVMQINTKSVEFPVTIGNNNYVIKSVCVPEIKVKFKVPHINKLIELLKNKGHILAYKKFDGMHDEIVSNLKFILGAKDWVAIMKMKSGIVEYDNIITGYYEVPDGLMLVGSIKDWLHNSHYIHENKNVVSNATLNVEISQNDGSVCEYETYEKTYDTLCLNSTVSNEMDGTSFDILDIASYSELENKYELVLNMDASTKIRFVEESESERAVTDFILKNSYRDEENRHVVAIPWLSRYKKLLNNNERLSQCILKSIKKKYDTVVLKKIDEVFKDQIASNIIERVWNWDQFKTENPGYSFIGHFPVIKNEKNSSKVRIVYMANLAQKNEDGSDGFSLNKCVHPGFCKNNKIAHAFLFMRFSKWILGYDISKAYHNMGISNENSAKFLFLWFKNIDKGDYTPVVYKFNRVIFGLSVSPFLLSCALYKFLVLEQNEDIADERNDKIKKLNKLIYQNSYADNIVIGCDREDELLFMYDESVNIFEKNLFPLQQFVTNHSQFQENIDLKLQTKTPTEVKLLGMKYDREKDSLLAPECKFNEQVTTKRKILGEINKAYDLMNVNLPVLNRSKLFLRKLQMDKNLNWDDNIGKDRCNQWKTIARQYNAYSSLEVPRFVGGMNSNYSLFIFSDASKDFIGTCLYLKENDSNNISFLEAHNKMLDKVMQSRTMPVLELCAVEFGIEKGMEIFNILSSALVPIKITDIRLFTDSMITLSWINKSENLLDKPQKRSVFVNNRINNIVNHCKKVHEVRFTHIGTSQNPSDFVTRAVSPKLLIKSNYLKGPEILLTDMVDFEWILVPNPKVDNDPNLPRFSVNKIEVQCLGESINLRKYSSLQKATKVLQKVRLFINKSKMKVYLKNATKFPRFQKEYHISHEYKDCNLELLKLDQERDFFDEFNYLKRKGGLKSEIPTLVSQLNVVYDLQDKLLKVKSKMGKLTNNTMSKTPILLSKNSIYLKLLINDLHKEFNHAGVYFLLKQIKTKFYVLKAYSAIKNIIIHCVHCKRFNSRAIKVNTNDYKEWMVHPKERVFGTSFVDYFGPYFTKYGNERIKTYGIIFKCFWSKMINVEVVIAADTKSFLMAFQNHIYKYGLPSILYSDAGSQLSSGFSWIRDVLNTVEVGEYLDTKGIKKCTVDQYPKGSLNRGIGGVIESGVATMKKFIQGAIRNNCLDFISFCHVINQCICYANKRPITDKTFLRESKTDDIRIITPELLAFGYETCVVEVNIPKQDLDDWSETNLPDPSIAYKDIHKLVRIKEQIRENYYSDFLYDLMDQATRIKNKYLPVKHQIINVGDIVLIKDPFVKAHNYPMGVVTKVMLNTLGEATQVEIYKANKCTIKRDISSILLLLKNESDEKSDGTKATDRNKELNNNFSQRPIRLAGLKCKERLRDLWESEK